MNANQGGTARKPSSLWGWGLFCVVEPMTESTEPSPRERPSHTPNKGASSVPVHVDVPRVERKHVLLYLARRLEQLRRPLDRPQVEAIAGVLEHDAQSKHVRPFTEVCHDAKLKNGFSRDPFLSRVAVRYDLDELGKTFPPFTDDPADPTGLVDALAGSGPPRPLLKELYSLESVGSTVVLSPPTPPLTLDELDDFLGRQLFLPTSRGGAHADALHDIFARLNWGGDANLLLLVERSGSAITRRCCSGKKSSG